MSSENQSLSLGIALQQARMQCGCSVQNAADKLNLSTTIILDIESSVEQLIENKKYPLIYLRGYIVNFSKLVDLYDFSSFVEFEALSKQQKKIKILSKPSLFTLTTKKKRNVGVFSIIFCVVLLGCLIIGYWDSLVKFTDLTEISTHNIIPVIFQKKLANLEMLITETKNITIFADKREKTKKIIKKDVSVNVNQKALLKESVKSEHIVKKENERKSKIIPVSSTETIVASLLLTYSADCWTEIKDAENKRVAFGLYEKGRVLTLQGVPPFQLTLGDPSVVAIQYQHEIVTYKFDAGKRAVFTLPMT